jgi:hypothetical protein
MRLKKSAVRRQRQTVFCIAFEAITEPFNGAVSLCFVEKRVSQASTFTSHLTPALRLVKSTMKTDYHGPNHQPVDFLQSFAINRTSQTQTHESNKSSNPKLFDSCISFKDGWYTSTPPPHHKVSDQLPSCLTSYGYVRHRYAIGAPLRRLTVAKLSSRTEHRLRLTVRLQA